MTFFRRLRRKIRKRFFPTKAERILRRWSRDQGELKLRLEYDLNWDSLVFDVGGYDGDWAYAIHSRYGCPLFVFEAVESYAAILKARFAGNKAIQVCPYGLAGKTKDFKIAVRANDDAIFSPLQKAQQIQLFDVADWFATNNIAEVALMKINIEGGEYELLERMIEKSLVGRVVNFQIQFHDIAPDSGARMEAIKKCLSATHECTYEYRFLWENWRRKPVG